MDLAILVNSIQVYLWCPITKPFGKGCEYIAEAHFVLPLQMMNRQIFQQSLKVWTMILSQKLCQHSGQLQL